MLFKAIRKGFDILSNPQKEYDKLHERKFESVLGDYLLLLISVAILTGIVSFLYSIVKGFYLDVWMTIDVQYIRMFNYSLGRSTSLMFFYLFAGTFFVFIISAILKPFFRKVKYTALLGIIFYAATPFLLFSWIPVFVLPLAIWSVFLFIQGIKSHKKVKKISKSSIEQRD